MLKKALYYFNLWCANNDDFIAMHKHHKVTHQVAQTQGYKFMRNGWIIVFIILFIIMCIGNT